MYFFKCSTADSLVCLGYFCFFPIIVVCLCYIISDSSRTKSNPTRVDLFDDKLSTEDPCFLTRLFRGVVSYRCADNVYYDSWPTGKKSFDYRAVVVEDWTVRYSSETRKTIPPTIVRMRYCFSNLGCLQYTICVLATINVGCFKVCKLRNRPQSMSLTNRGLGHPYCRLVVPGHAVPVMCILYTTGLWGEKHTFSPYTYVRWETGQMATLGQRSAIDARTSFCMHAQTVPSLAERSTAPPPYRRHDCYHIVVSRCSHHPVII